DGNRLRRGGECRRDAALYDDQAGRLGGRGARRLRSDAARAARGHPGHEEQAARAERARHAAAAGDGDRAQDSGAGVTDDDTLMELRTFGFLPEAQLAASALEAAGIDCLLREPFISGAQPELTNALGGVTLLVPRCDVQSARE